MDYDQKTLDEIEYNVSDVVVDSQQELNKFVANLMKIDYTELEANNIKERLLNDQSGSDGNFKTRFERNTFGNRQQQQVAVHSESVRGTDVVGVDGQNSREDGRRISPEVAVATRTGERGELNTDYQKADSEQEPAFSMSKQDSQAYVSTSRHNDLHER